MYYHIYIYICMSTHIYIYMCIYIYIYVCVHQHLAHLEGTCGWPCHTQCFQASSPGFLSILFFHGWSPLVAKRLEALGFLGPPVVPFSPFLVWRVPLLKYVLQTKRQLVPTCSNLSNLEDLDTSDLVVGARLPTSLLEDLDTSDVVFVLPTFPIQEACLRGDIGLVKRLIDARASARSPESWRKKKWQGEYWVYGRAGGGGGELPLGF